VVSCPWNAHLYRLNDRTTRDVALRRVKDTMEAYHFPVAVLHFLILSLDSMVLFALFLGFLCFVYLGLYLAGLVPGLLD
jgi:hypothetical protein